MVLTARATFSALLSALGALLFGLDIGYIAPILGCPSFNRDVAHLSEGETLSDATRGFIVAIFSLGCIFTSFPLVSGYFMDIWGRRDTIILGSGLFLIGCLVQAAAGSVSVMMAGRLVAGLSIGLLSPGVALYQSEVSPPAYRGALTSLYQLMVTFGILVATLLDRELVDRDGGWRVAVALQAVPGCALLFGMPLLPRSPRWLVQRGREQEALAALMALRDSEDEARQELSEVVATCREAKALGTPQWLDLTKGFVSRLLLVGVCLQLLQQLVGMNAFMYFGPEIFQTMGLDTNKFQVIICTVNFAATFPAILCSDSFGRRSLLLVGAAAMCAACLAMGAAGRGLTAGGHSSSSVSLARGLWADCVIGSIFVFIASFAASWGPMVWVYCAEIFPLQHRSRCMGVVTTANWVGNYIIAQATPILLGTLGFETFFIFGFFCLLALAGAWWLPETKGVPLESMEAIFKERFGIAEGKSSGSRANGAALGGYGTCGPDGSKDGGPGGLAAKKV